MEQAAALEEQCEHEKETCTTLEGCQKSHKFLVQAEELSDLDERIEGLDAQAEYVALSIAEQERKIQEGLNTKFSFLPFSPSVDASIAKCALIQTIISVFGRDGDLDEFGFSCSQNIFIIPHTWHLANGTGLQYRLSWRWLPLMKRK